MQVERESGAIHEYSGVRVSNTWVIYLLVRNNRGKLRLILHNPTAYRGASVGILCLWEIHRIPAGLDPPYTGRRRSHRERPAAKSELTRPVPARGGFRTSRDTEWQSQLPLHYPVLRRIL